ncbi:DegT/DnrJ/EryC1/StrS family aminotransferase [Sesbania bispinosa]|nr:DegT/DnrJ/EryC1/StrS family aminotransferase [Sesbania bispinosa]
MRWTKFDDHEVPEEFKESVEKGAVTRGGFGYRMKQKKIEESGGKRRISATWVIHFLID